MYEEHWVAVPPHLDSEPVRNFGCFTKDLQELANWLVGCGIETVAMQSTGVYWIALYDMLSERGIRVFLINARDTKNLPGRKTDIQECQWLLKLHVYGLLKNSFRPDEEILVMRSYFPPGGEKSVVSIEGGDYARWRGDGRVVLCFCPWPSFGR